MTQKLVQLPSDKRHRPALEASDPTPPAPPPADVGGPFAHAAGTLWCQVHRVHASGTSERCEQYDAASSLYTDRLPVEHATAQGILTRWGSGTYILGRFGSEEGKVKALGRSQPFTLEDAAYPARGTRSGGPSSRAASAPAAPAAPSLDELLRLLSAAQRMQTSSGAAEREQFEERLARIRIEEDARRRRDREEEEDRRRRDREEYDRRRQEDEERHRRSMELESMRTKTQLELERERHRMQLEQLAAAAPPSDVADQLEELREELRAARAAPAPEAGLMASLAPVLGPMLGQLLSQQQQQQRGPVPPSLEAASAAAAQNQSAGSR